MIDHAKQIAFLTAIQDERNRQEKIHGEINKNVTLEGYFCILLEEVGEAVKEINDAKVEIRSINQVNLRKELVQVASVCCQMAELLKSDDE